MKHLVWIGVLGVNLCYAQNIEEELALLKKKTPFMWKMEAELNKDTLKKFKGAAELITRVEFKHRLSKRKEATYYVYENEDSLDLKIQEWASQFSCAAHTEENWWLKCVGSFDSKHHHYNLYPCSGCYIWYKKCQRLKKKINPAP